MKEQVWITDDEIVVPKDYVDDTISKKKVLEAIDKIFDRGPRSWRATKRYCELKKELGLE